jgi:hypothetical protein
MHMVEANKAAAYRALSQEMVPEEQILIVFLAG